MRINESGWREKDAVPKISDYPLLLDENMAATYLGLSPKTLQAWRFRGLGPTFRKIGRLVKYLREDLDSFIQEQARRSTSEGK